MRCTSLTFMCPGNLERRMLTTVFLDRRQLFLSSAPNFTHRTEHPSAGRATDGCSYGELVANRPRGKRVSGRRGDAQHQSTKVPRNHSDLKGLVCRGFGPDESHLIGWLIASPSPPRSNGCFGHNAPSQLDMYCLISLEK